ncbi:MAG: hypothetical protein JWP97_2600 [Labilithrix sp.]|nr:hypothetical protein [Labilithrix sp.]
MALSVRTALASAVIGVVVFVGCSSSNSDAPAVEADAGLDAGPPCSRLTTVCQEGGACEGAPDCASALCRDGTCQNVDPPNGQKDHDETDVDCGGAHAPACPDLGGCLVPQDCTSTVCTGGVCQVPSPTDGVKNGDETGKDCGGAKAPKCPEGQGCASDADCNALRCDLVNKKCLPATHDDGIKNLDETGVDCGGPTATVKRCATGESCVATTDCDNVLCNATGKKCDPPTPTDGLKNGSETDVDCGGTAPTNAPKCVISKTCKANSDCSSNGCSANTGTCDLPSCASGETAGIVTCGAKETGEAGATHESCCKSLVLPTRTTRRLDKYEITAGRFRTFINSVGPDVRTWAKTFATANPTSQLASLVALGGPSVAPGGGDLTSILPAQDVAGAHSLTAHLETDIDNYDGVRGCVNDYDPGVAGSGNYSANTYWMDKTHMNAVQIEERALARSYSDEKSMNCAMPLMFAAFCAWDGGEMATLADYRDAWVKPTDTYPWGPTDVKRPNYNFCNGTYNNGGFKCQCDPTVHPDATKQDSCPAGGVPGFSGGGTFYEWPRNTDRSRDNEPLIGAPGRFLGDATVKKSGGESWMDLWANLAEYTGDFTASASRTWCDYSAGVNAGDPTCTRSGHAGNLGTKYTNIPAAGIIGNSWEGHEYGYGSGNAFEVTFQYGKFGARCVRPATPY